jgi:hypothetical protein
MRPLPPTLLPPHLSCPLTTLCSTKSEHPQPSLMGQVCPSTGREGSEGQVKLKPGAPSSPLDTSTVTPSRASFMRAVLVRLMYEAALWPVR